MSHFYVIAIVPESCENIEEFVSENMEKYSENREVEPYDHECSCIGWIAEKAGYEEAIKKFGTVDDLRKSYVPVRKKVLEDMGADPTISSFSEGWTREIDKAIDKSWKEHTNPFNDCKQEVQSSHPMFDKPDPKCDECHGTGVYQSTYNPDSQWDWYRIGGRWDGAITHTEDNSEDNGFNFGVHHESKSKNAITASRFLDNFTPKDVPYAILDPDGEWHQRGKVGWWGLSSDESDTWDTDAHEILKKYRDGYVFVGLDCHI